MPKIKFNQLPEAAQKLVRSKFDPIMTEKQFESHFNCHASQLFVRDVLWNNGFRELGDLITFEDGAACFGMYWEGTDSYCVYPDGSLWYRDVRISQIWESARSFIEQHTEYFQSLWRYEPDGYKHIKDFCAFVDAEGF